MGAVGGGEGLLQGRGVAALGGGAHGDAGGGQGLDGDLLGLPAGVEGGLLVADDVDAGEQLAVLLSTGTTFWLK